jgi:hypothetical protein|tara:strand:+ start:614 stop:859 length:246 start_codon:yes stop_codon:yes gene_type:complete
MSKKIFKEVLVAINTIKKTGLEISELCIHMETPEGEVMELDIDIDEDTGELIKSFNRFETQDEYVQYLDETDEIPEGILYN